MEQNKLKFSLINKTLSNNKEVDSILSEEIIDLNSIFEKGFKSGKTIQVNIITVEMHDKSTKKHCASILIKMARKLPELQPKTPEKIIDNQKNDTQEKKDQKIVKKNSKINDQKNQELEKQKLLKQKQQQQKEQEEQEKKEQEIQRQKDIEDQQKIQKIQNDIIEQRKQYELELEKKKKHQNEVQKRIENLKKLQEASTELGDDNQILNQQINNPQNIDTIQEKTSTQLNLNKQKKNEDEIEEILDNSFEDKYNEENDHNQQNLPQNMIRNGLKKEKLVRVQGSTYNNIQGVGMVQMKNIQNRQQHEVSKSQNQILTSKPLKRLSQTGVMPIQQNLKQLDHDNNNKQNNVNSSFSNSFNPTRPLSTVKKNNDIQKNRQSNFDYENYSQNAQENFSKKPILETKKSSKNNIQDQQNLNVLQIKLQNNKENENNNLDKQKQQQDQQQKQLEEYEDLIDDDNNDYY